MENRLALADDDLLATVAEMAHLRRLIRLAIEGDGAAANRLDGMLVDLIMERDKLRMLLDNAISRNR